LKKGEKAGTIKAKKRGVNPGKGGYKMTVQGLVSKKKG